MGKIDPERLARNERITSDWPPVEQDALGLLLQRWDLLPTAPLAFLLAPSGAPTQTASGFRTEIVYTPCESAKAWRCPWKVLGLPRPGEDEILVGEIPGAKSQAPSPLLVLRFRMWRPGASTFLEMRWDPTTNGECLDFRNLDPTTARSDLAELLKANGVPNSVGRPVGTSNITSAMHLTDLVLSARRALEGEPGRRKPATQAEVAEFWQFYLRDARGVRYQCDHWHITWATLQSLPLGQG